MSNHAYMTTVMAEKSSLAVELAQIPMATLRSVGFRDLPISADGLHMIVQDHGQIETVVQDFGVDLVGNFIRRSVSSGGQRQDDGFDAIDAFLEDIYNSSVLMEFSDGRKFSLRGALGKVMAGGLGAYGTIVTAVVNVGHLSQAELTAVLILSPEGLILVGAGAGLMYLELLKRADQEGLSQ